MRRRSVADPAVSVAVAPAPPAGCTRGSPSAGASTTWSAGRSGCRSISFERRVVAGSSPTPPARHGDARDRAGVPPRTQRTIAPVTLQPVKPRSDRHSPLPSVSGVDERGVPTPGVTLHARVRLAVAERDGVLELTAVRARADRGHPGRVGRRPPTVPAPGPALPAEAATNTPARPRTGTRRRRRRRGRGVSEPIE